MTTVIVSYRCNQSFTQQLFCAIHADLSIQQFAKAKRFFFLLLTPW